MAFQQIFKNSAYTFKSHFEQLTTEIYGTWIGSLCFLNLVEMFITLVQRNDLKNNLYLVDFWLT